MNSFLNLSRIEKFYFLLVMFIYASFSAFLVLSFLGIIDGPIVDISLYILDKILLK